MSLDFCASKAFCFIKSFVGDMKIYIVKTAVANCGLWVSVELLHTYTTADVKTTKTTNTPFGCEYSGMEFGIGNGCSEF